MRPRWCIGVLGVLICIGAGYAVGRFRSGMSAFVAYEYEYEGQSVRAVFPRNHPTYGLPLVEYSLILQAFDDGHTNVVRRYLRTFLNAAISEGEHREKAVKWDGIEKGHERIASAIQMGRDALHSYTNQLPPFSPVE